MNETIEGEVVESKELMVKSPQALSTWGGAAKRGLEARNERAKIIQSVLVSEADYGSVPGVPKPFLFKSGAEKVADSLDLYPDYEEMMGTKIDQNLGYWCFRYRCLLKQRGSDVVIATGVGSCNSMEVKYRYRKDERTCPDCGKKGTIIKGKEEYGGGWFCWAKREGCGSKWPDGAKAIEGQSVAQIENPDVFDQLNTGDKMAQKRALVAAALNLGFSEQFTQDPEMLGYDEPQADKPRETPQGEKPKAGDAPVSLTESINSML